MKRESRNSGSSPAITTPDEESLDRRQLLEALQRVRAGDFSVQLPTTWTGMDGKIKRDDPVKNHPHSDYGDAFCYLVSGMAPGAPERPTQPPRVERPWDLFHAHRPASMQPPTRRWGRR